VPHRSPLPFRPYPRRHGVVLRWSNPRLLLSALVQLLAVAWLAGTQRPSEATLAYIDPGSGALLLQLAASFAVGLLFYLRSVRQFFVRLFRRLAGRDAARKPDVQG